MFYSVELLLIGSDMIVLLLMLIMLAVIANKEFLGFNSQTVDNVTTGLLWLKLLDVKGKQCIEALTTEEKALVKATTDEFNVPSPIFTYLSQIGSYTDGMGKESYPNVPSLPTSIVENLGGYHAASEYQRGTRFNLQYTRHISDQLGRLSTFKVEKVNFSKLSRSGSERLVIETLPNAPVNDDEWTTATVQVRSASTSSTAHIRAAYCFGFQLHKGDGPGDTPRERIRNWSCVTGPEWVIMWLTVYGPFRHLHIKGL